MSDLPFTTWHRASPLYRETADERAEREAAEMAALVEDEQREIEAVADGLSTFWDKADSDWDADEVKLAQDCAAWLQTMPQHLKDRVLAQIESDRRRYKPLRPLTVFGRTFKGHA